MLTTSVVAKEGASVFGAGPWDCEPASPGSGPVRVRYFDPLTGDPCEEKPVPRSKQLAARGKAAPKRAKKDWKWKARGHRRCIVDGVEYESIAAAARAVGVNNNSLGRALRDGLAVYRGHFIRWCA
ncbi:hypothetical protein [Senegalimassilia anaerobia]|uniref:hypothetical protein n=1 Tax=Senegalimassilia anaerobia TaxID=1473216 RepID=UPI003A9884FE